MADIRINRARGTALEDLDVVVVDDSKPMQTIVRSMLNAARIHRVRTFDNAGDAYRSMLVEPPHLLVTDWNLPDIDGLSLVRSLRDPRSGPLVSVPVILITGHATRRLVENAIASGIHFVLAKPLSPSNVMKRITAAIGDPRRFVLDAESGRYILEGASELLAGQRQRWREIHEGALDPRPTQRATRAAPITVPADRPAPVADGRRAVPGFGAPIHLGPPVETSTGQAPSQAS